MNKLIRTLFTLASLGLMAGTARADVAFKPVVVDMAKVFESHYKTEEAYAKFNEFGQKVQEQLDGVSKKIQDLATQYQDLVEQSNNSMLKPEARAKAQTDAQEKGKEIQRLQNEAQNFKSQNELKIQQRVKSHRDGLLEEISLVVKNMARAKGATLVLDKSACVYFDDSYDMTEEVIKEVNKDRPPAPPAPAPAAAGQSTGTPAPAAPSAPAPVPAPAPTPTK